MVRQMLQLVIMQLLLEYLKNNPDANLKTIEDERLKKSTMVLW